MKLCIRSCSIIPTWCDIIYIYISSLTYLKCLELPDFVMICVPLDPLSTQLSPSVKLLSTQCKPLHRYSSLLTRGHNTLLITFVSHLMLLLQPLFPFPPHFFCLLFTLLEKTFVPPPPPTFCHWATPLKICVWCNELDDNIYSFIVLTGITSHENDSNFTSFILVCTLVQKILLYFFFQRIRCIKIICVYFNSCLHKGFRIWYPGSFSLYERHRDIG